MESQKGKAASEEKVRMGLPPLVRAAGKGYDDERLPKRPNAKDTLRDGAPEAKKKTKKKMK